MHRYADGGECADIGRRDDRRQKPLERHERRPPGAGGRRARRHRVHSVRGRRPRKLHGSGHIRRVPDGNRLGRAGTAAKLREPGQDVADVRRPGPGAVRHNLRERPDETGVGVAPPRPIRRDHHRTLLVGLRVVVVRGHQIGLAAHLRHAATGDRLHGARHHRPPLQPDCRFQPIGPSRRSKDVRPEVDEHRSAGVRRVRARVQGVDFPVQRTESVLRFGRARPTVVSVREQPFHNRLVQADHDERNQRRRYTFESTAKFINSK